MVVFIADEGECFEPEDAQAPADMWVRGRGGFEGSVQYRASDFGSYERALARLTYWQNAQKPLSVELSVRECIFRDPVTEAVVRLVRDQQRLGSVPAHG